MSMKKQNNNLLASIAVFAELCDIEKDIKSILKEFIISIYELEKTHTLDVTSATKLCYEHFDFHLPEAVVKTCLNSLKSENLLEKRDGKYFKTAKRRTVGVFEGRLEKKKDVQSEIETRLIRYY